MGKIDTFSKTIENCDFMTFRELAIFSLPFIGLKEAKLTDGWKDGGTDVKVAIYKGTEINISVQISVEKKWESKIISDTRKISKHYPNVRAVYYMSSKRLPEREFEKIRQKVFDDYSISLFKYDNQGISTALMQAGKVEEGLTKINYDVPKLLELRKGYRRFDPTNSAMLSLLFFSNEITQTRDIKLSSEIISLIFESNNEISETDIVTNLTSRYSSEIIKRDLQNLRGKNEIYGDKAKISLKKELYETLLANEIVKTKEIENLRTLIERKILMYNKSRSITPDQVNLIIENLGSFYVQSSGRISTQLNHNSNNYNSVQQLVKEGIKRLHLLLDDVGVDPRENKEDILYDICLEASKTTLMESLAAAEVIRSLDSLTSDDLMIALGADNDLVVLLDSSVSIPILCSYLFKPTKESFIFFSNKMYEACISHNIEIQITKEYIEEMSTHLIYAHKKYYQAIKADEALAYSENGYVAHFVGLKYTHNDLLFEDFLDHLGLTKNLQTYFPYADDDVFHYVKATVMSTLTGLLQKAKITIMDTIKVPFKTKKTVEQEIAFALRELGNDRPKILLDHDVMVISYLKEKAQFSGPKYIISTWDRVHFIVRNHLPDANWETFDPTILLDILHMCKPEEDFSFGNSSIEIIKKMGEEELRNAALIWDTIADIEKQDFTAVLVKKAKQFKNEYLNNSENKLYKSDIKDKWQKWKENSN